MTLVRARRHAAAARLCLLLTLLACSEAETPRGSPLDLGPKRYSQNDEELIIRHFFGDRRNGVFLDVGAYHWRDGSTTLYLERHLGWSGIAVDALPTLAAGYAKHRPQTRFRQFIVGDRSGEVATLFAAGQVSSVVEDHIRQYPQAGDVKPREIQVPTITLDDLLAKERVETIDFLSMNIEEAEPAALAGFDIERYRPALVCIEANKRVRERLLAYFAAHGYERIDAYLAVDEINWYFRPSVGSK